MKFSFEGLQQLVKEVKDPKRLAHIFLSYHTDLYNHINSSDFDEKSNDRVQQLLTQLDQQIEFFHDDKNKDVLSAISQPIAVSIAKNYTTLLSKSKIKLYDITDKFVTVFSDLKKVPNLRNLSSVILSYIYESFGKEVTSFIPLILTLSLKQIKKEKTHLLNLATLLSTVIRNGGQTELTDSAVSKYHRILKHATDIEVLAVLYGCYGKVATYKKVDLITFKTTNFPYFQAGLTAHKKVRAATAKSLAEALSQLEVSPKEKFEIFVDLYIDDNTSNLQLGVIQSIIHYNNLLFVKDPETLNTNFLEIITTVLSIFKHERVAIYKSNARQRLIGHCQLIFDSCLGLVGESTQKAALADLFKLLDKEPTVNEMLVILQVIESIISRISGLSDHEIELYHINLWKLSTSKEQEVRIFTVQALKTFVVKFPTLLREVLETSLNELINNSKQASSDKVFYKSHGYALILANMIELADKDYVPESFFKDVWKFTTGILKQKVALTEINYQNYVVCWISIIGIFYYPDKSLVEDLVPEFLDFWVLPSKMISKSLRLVDLSLTAVLGLVKNIVPSRKVADIILEMLNRLRSKLKIAKENGALESIIDSIEKRLFQIYLRLIKYVKTENSSVLIHAIHKFSVLPNYEITKNEKEIPFNERDDGFSNGITSKFRGHMVDELNLKYDDMGTIEEKEYSIDHIARPTGAIGLSKVKSWLTETTWIDTLDNSAISPISSSLLNDLFQPILGNYSVQRKFAPPVKTVVIDTAIEIFVKVFPFLSAKVQLSLLETLRSHLLSKMNSENTKIAVAINTSIIIHGILTTAIHENLTLDKSVGVIILETSRYSYGVYPSRYLLTLNSESIGILVSRTPLTEQIPIFIKQIVDNDEAESRSFNALLLSNIYQYNASHFTQILEVLLKLSLDPHPSVHAWSLDALSTIIDKHLAINSNKAIEILSMLENVYLSDKYGKFTSGSLPDLNVDNDSNVVISRVLRSLVNSLGPGVKDLDLSQKQVLFNITCGLLYNSNDPIVQCEILRSIQEWSVYDKDAFKLEKIIDLLKFIIQSNLGQVVGSNLSLPLYEGRNEVFPTTSSPKLLNVAFDFLSQLVKTLESKAFIKDLEYLIWIGLELNPESLLLKNLVAEWIDSTYGISWFVKLQHLLNSSKVSLYAQVFKDHQAILNKYTQKKVEVDVKDEESQSIATYSTQFVKGEPANWRFKIVILNFIKQILNYTLKDSKLHHQISQKISDLIKISYSSSTSLVPELRLLGISLLGDIIDIYADSKDPIYPDMPLLEQQQAQITSALIPAFQSDSTPLLASSAIKVVATFIGSSIVSVSRLSRVTKILDMSLDDLKNDEEELRINDVLITSETGRRRVKLAILNAWAELMILAKDDEITALVNDHLDLLLPLWISTLKEYEVLKHGSGNTDLYQECWINIVDVIGVITEKNQESIVDLLGHDVLGFYYLVYSDCVYALLGANSSPTDKVRIMKVLLEILKFESLVELIFHDDIFHETIEIVERLIITSTIDVKLILTDISTLIFTNFFALKGYTEKLNLNIDKLFELVRITLQPIIELLPVKDDTVKMKDLDVMEAQLLKKSFRNVVRMVSLFPNLVKSDLFSSILSIIEKTYVSYPKVVTKLIPIIKDVLDQLSIVDDYATINNFYQSIKPTLITSNVNALLTIGILLTSTQNHLRLNNDDIEYFVETLIRELFDPAMVAIVTQTIKTVIKQDTDLSRAVLNHLIPHLILKSISLDDPRIPIELVILISKQYPSKAIYSILVPTFLQIFQRNGSFGEYVHNRLISLVSLNPEYFKSVVNDVLDDEQRVVTENLMKFKTAEVEQENGKIKLKAFE